MTPLVAWRPLHGCCVRFTAESTDRRTDKRSDNRWTSPLHKASLKRGIASIVLTVSVKVNEEGRTLTLYRIEISELIVTKRGNHDVREEKLETKF